MAEVTCFVLYIRRRDTSQHNVNYYYVFIFLIKCDKSLKIAQKLLNFKFSIHYFILNFKFYRFNFQDINIIFIIFV